MYMLVSETRDHPSDQHDVHADEVNVDCGLRHFLLLVSRRGQFGVHDAEPEWRTHGQNEGVNVVVWELWGTVDFSQNLIRSVAMHVVVAVPLDAK